MLFRRSIWLLLLSQALFGARLPEIKPSDVKTILNQIMEGHVTHKDLTPTLIQRSLELYLEELDPTKTYFLASEVKPWINPPQDLLEKAASNIKKKDFSLYVEIQEEMVQAIERRKHLEEKLLFRELPKDVSIREFKELKWAETEEELLERIIRIKALQAETAGKLNGESREKVLKRIAKKQQLREEEFTSKNPQIKERVVLTTALKAIASSFDTHTAYFTPAEAAQFMIQLQQRLFGIGAQLKDDLNGFTIVKIIDGGPASRNTGLKVNDRIIAINGEPVVGMEITDTVELIRGDVDTPIFLTVLREKGDGGKEEAIEIKIIRGEVVIKEARIQSTLYPYGDGVIAHIALHAFYQDPQHSSASDLYEEMQKISKENKIKGIVLDLRLNSGGVLPQAVAVTGLFITKGIVVSIKDNTGRVEHLRDIEGKTAYDGPLIILTSKASASAAEIVAGSLQDYGRALVVGDAHTFGKGTFQTFTLESANYSKVNPKGEHKVTRGRYYTVSGKSPQLFGVKADIVVPGPFSHAEIGERYAKYPLENDSIPENYQDDLSDIPESQREQISWLYRYNLQPCLKTYVRHLPMLRKNAEKRIEGNKLYWSFLEEIAKEDPNPAPVTPFIENDLQLQETINVMKDLILLTS